MDIGAEENGLYFAGVNESAAVADLHMKMNSGSVGSKKIDTEKACEAQ